MTKVTMKLNHEVFQQQAQFHCDGRHNALFVVSGELSVGGKPIAPSCGIYVGKSSSDPITVAAESEILRFVVDPSANARAPTKYGRTVLETSFELTTTEAFMRLDQVSFPPGARAYRHIHPGAGIRYLTKGELEIESDHGTGQIVAGNAWFEDANSPVQATASEMHETAFVRTMILPIEYLGKPTITYLNPSDDDKPRLQTNTRFFDQPIDF